MITVVCPHCQRIDRVVIAYEHIRYKCDCCGKRYTLHYTGNGDEVESRPVETEPELRIVK